MSIKLIAIDIDGTLLNEKNELAPATIDAVKAASAQGIKVVLCSGRPLTGVAPYIQELGISGDDQYAVTYNGAVAQTVSGKVLINHALSFNDYIDLEALSRKLQVSFQIETPDYIYTANKDINPYTIFESNLVKMLIRYRSVGEMPRDVTVSKAMFVDSPANIDRIKPLIPQDFHDKYYVVQSTPFFIEVMNKEASKGNALRGLAADAVTLTNAEDGVAAAIRKYALK